MSYAVEFRITLGTDNEQEALERQELLSDVITGALRTINGALGDSKVEIVDETLYTY